MATWKTIMARPAEYSPARASSREKSGREDRRGHRGSSRPPVVLGRVMELLEQFRARYPFSLDDFQLEAIRAIEAGQSVIVSAPTGAGKTLVAEFAIHMALATGKRIAYTTPLKALSNQKFNDFTRVLGAETVGILTGDVKVNPHGRVLVMTTEILRNALYGSGLEDLGYIVLDECHYMGDEGRGTVWEEIIVNAPQDVLLVGLSATVANVKEIADWISIVHRPIVPIFHPHRPVPLSYAVADLAGEVHEIAEVRAGRARRVGDESRGPDARGRWYTRRVVDPVVLIADLEARGWLPAIYFIFSRAGCERAMDDVLAEGRGLLTAAQRDDVERAINELVEESPTVAESALNQTVFQALRLGVGLHHAGILPSVKRLIELSFERGLCKVVFATETMSLGIHMPARSVVLQGVTKRTDRGFRALSHNELTQMAGRAGRRGIDPEGKCVIALDARDRGAGQEAEARRQALGRGGRRGERGVAEAETGRLALVRRKGGPGLALILGTHSIRGHRVLIDALLPHGAVVRVKSGVVKRIFWATPPLHVPRDLDRTSQGRGRDGRGLRHLAVELGRLSVAELVERERQQGPETALSAIECHRCPWGAQPRCEHEWRELETLTERLGVRQRALEQVRSAYWHEFLRVVEVLEQFGAVRERRLEPRGRLIAGLRHDNELLVAECVFRGVFADLAAAEAAAVCSALIEEARSGDPAIARDFLKKRPRLRRKLDQLASLANTIHEAQRARHLRMPLAVHPGFMPAVYRWAGGEDDWGAIVEESFGGHEGDLIRAMRRRIDLLRQVAAGPEVPPETARLLAQAARVIDRGIVLESALI